MPHGDAGSLARRVFEVVNDDPGGLRSLLHPDADVELPHAPGRIVHGRDEVMAVIEDELIVIAVREATPQVVVPVDDERVVIEGRMRLSSSGGGFRDSHAVWALAFDDGLLRSLRRASSVDDAVRTLGGSRSAPGAAGRLRNERR